MSDLFDWIFRKENWSACEWLGFVFFLTPLAYTIKWMSEIFIIMLVLQMSLGLILLIAGFDNRRAVSKDRVFK